MAILGGGAGRMAVGVGGVALLGLFLGVHVWKDLNADVGAWYFHSTPLWIGVMALATGIYVRETAALRRAGVDLDERFRELPPE